MGVQPGPMSNLQSELLKLFAEQIDREMTALQEEKGWGDSTIETWKHERLRAPY